MVKPVHIHICLFAILSEDELDVLGKKYGVEDKRKRKLSLVPFFWLMVLSAIEADSRGCLSKLVVFFAANFSRLYPGDKVIGISRMALSTKMSSTNWMFKVPRRIPKSQCFLFETLK
jgi:hypothetical protein